MSEYIDKKAFIDFIDAGHLRYATEKVFSENDVVKMISEQHAADVEPVVRATWIKTEFNGTDEHGVPFKRDAFYCSNCGNMVFIGNDKRCHSCFAHMERSGSGE